MALHDPVEDALNERKKRARLVEAGGALSPDNLDITRQFLGGRQLPGQASDTARSRAFGQQGLARRNRTGAVAPIVQEDERIIPSSQPPLRDRVGSLSDRFFNLPSPVDFARTPQGSALMKRILQLRGLR